MAKYKNAVVVLKTGHRLEVVVEDNFSLNANNLTEKTIFRFTLRRGWFDKPRAVMVQGDRIDYLLVDYS